MIGELQEYLAGRVGRFKDVRERAAAGPLLVRLGIAVFAALSMVLAFPSQVTRNLAGIVVAGVVALLPAAFPRGRMVGLAVFACAFGWLIGTLVYDQPLTVTRLIALSTALYLMHSLAALAAVLPYDAVVAPGVLLGWLLRAGGIVAVSAIVSVVLLAVVELVAGPVFLVASLVGVVAAGALAWLVARRA
ncbi:hypothetical protein Drose_33475 [Dactylosporangium roseum]|uniref:Integral membrane protein n=1 Tax=Dactylosporangium roseum TaxID=47989 RepID=A0ABY5Z5C3_9ACTN|nr:hypothetical protein [Dactylosporangium roseum]UWZ35943.1 hypothetical protein Drose_33475 [Dactylosporangium roseum]